MMKTNRILRIILISGVILGVSSQQQGSNDQISEPISQSSEAITLQDFKIGDLSGDNTDILLHNLGCNNRRKLHFYKKNQNQKVSQGERYQNIQDDSKFETTYDDKLHVQWWTQVKNRKNLEPQKIDDTSNCEQSSRQTVDYEQMNKSPYKPIGIGRKILHTY